MATIAPTAVSSMHRIDPIVRWAAVLTLLLVSVAAVWGTYDYVNSAPSNSPVGDMSKLLTGEIFLGSILLYLFACYLILHRARIVIDGDKLTVHWVLSEVTLHANELEGYEYVQDKLQVYSQTRYGATTIEFFERLDVIEAWVQARTKERREVIRAAEDRAIRQDTSLGFDEKDKVARLAQLNTGIKHGNWVIYVACAIGIANAVLFGQAQVAQATIAVLLAIPLIFDLSALVYGGYIRVTSEGARYPEIGTATLVSGLVLVSLSVFDGGDLLDVKMFIELVVAGCLIKGIAWCLLDREQWRTIAGRGRGAWVLSLLGTFFVPLIWVTGGVYQVNRHFDISPVTWHATEVVYKQDPTNDLISFVIQSFTIQVAPWDDTRTEPFTYELSLTELDAVEIGTQARIGVRSGALSIPWVATIEPVPSQ